MFTFEFWGPGEEDLARKLKADGVEVQSSGQVYRASFQDKSSFENCLCNMEKLTDQRVYVQEADR
ncbi:MAG: hypothetical protein M0Z65_09035 [Firmicutes bacterium]|uniref:Sporulation related domain-containing protein n=1 Tax=Melghirimyces thermohalophilus TaxID=1236220 RepID=A0A1G6KW84_9BACL|nr:hypothetical protein [Melghirimyces thermohalophilus]MDA8353308.1 hypothetical protein [Bacillota bacterium]SDC35058.1 hypothetical protein SAMN04488112_106185 [Melghirimyces thermohalophilus]